MKKNNSGTPAESSPPRLLFNGNEQCQFIDGIVLLRRGKIYGDDDKESVSLEIQILQQESTGTFTPTSKQREVNIPFESAHCRPGDYVRIHYENDDRGCGLSYCNAIKGLEIRDQTRRIIEEHTIQKFCREYVFRNQKN